MPRLAAGERQYGSRVRVRDCPERGFPVARRVTLRLTRRQAERRAAFRVVGVQLVLTLPIAALSLALGGPRAAASALWGGAIGMAATALMALAVFRAAEGSSPGRVLWGVLFGQVLKITLTVALLMVAFRSPRVEPLALLGAYAVTFAAYWFASGQPARRH